MSEETTNPFRNPLGEIFARIVEKPDFAEAIRTHPDIALAAFTLTDADRAALIADAHALDGDVEGFASMVPGSRDFLNMIGGLRTPQRLGFKPNVSGWHGCLTCI